MGAAKAMDDGIMSMLCINEADIFANTTNTCSNAFNNGSSPAQPSPYQVSSQVAFKAAWNSFRLLALGIIVIAGLLMIISQALGFELFDAYTIKKTLPRILVAGIGITLSWQLLAFFVTFSNALGIGVRALIYSPFPGGGL